MRTGSRFGYIVIGVAMVSAVVATAPRAAEKFPIIWTNGTTAQQTYNRYCYATANPIIGHLNVARGMAREGYATGLWTWTDWIGTTPAARLARRVEIINDQVDFLAKGMLAAEGSINDKLARRLWRDIFAPLEPSHGQKRFLMEIEDATRNITRICHTMKRIAYGSP